MKEYILKNNDGSFALTESGEQEVLCNTAIKLISHYLKQGLNKSPDEINSSIKNLKEFIYKNFFSLNDYLGKFSEISRNIGENNIEKFQKFMGQYFLPTYKKEKSVFLTHQIELGKEKLNNPFWTPSYDFLKLYSKKFEEAPPLKFRPVAAKKENGNEPDEAKQKINIIDSVQTLENKISEFSVKAKVKKEPEQIMDLVTPGMKFLSLHEEVFRKAPVLKYIETSLISDDNEAEAENIKEIASASPSEPEQLIEKSKAVSAIPEKPEELPGKIFMEKYALKFNQSPGLELVEANLEKNSGIIEPLFSIKSYASLLGIISRFNKSGDTEGYRQWYTGLQTRQKAVVKINSLILGENKGKIVNWGKEIINCAVALNENKNDLYKLSGEIKIYGKIIKKIKFLLSNLNPPLSTSEISNIYSQTIIILNDSTSLEEKKSAIKILLLQIPGEENRKKIIKEFESFIELVS